MYGEVTNGYLQLTKFGFAAMEVHNTQLTPAEIAFGGRNSTENYNATNLTGTVPLEEYRSPFLGILLSFFSVSTVAGNSLVIAAVIKERCLRTATNYIIVSLAVADLIMGAFVMPFSIYLVMTYDQWDFGGTLCDVWRSMDVLGSTASILNLCVISLDRYWAITDPITYTGKTSPVKTGLQLLLVWLCSAAISFPAIAWWHHVDAAPQDGLCLFTEDRYYLLISSCISFYIPLAIMLYVNKKIYTAAYLQIKSLKNGQKVTHNDHGQKMTLRIHRGGMATGMLMENIRQNLSIPLSIVHDECDGHNDVISPDNACSAVQTMHRNSNHRHSNATKIQGRKQVASHLCRRRSRAARERRAAKTLGIVMGVFVCCWAPFFITHIIFAICKECVWRKEIIYPICTWLGYINSAMNPVIYSLSMRDFKKAFGKILFGCFPWYKTKMALKRRDRYMSLTTFTVESAAD